MRPSRSVVWFLLISVIILVTFCVGKRSRLPRKVEPSWSVPTGDYGTSANQLMHFVQFTDVHVSRWKSPERVTQFGDFLRNTVGAIRPDVVIGSGDLTDAKVGFGSKQYREEWETYHQTVLDSGVLNYSQVLDLPGNHDTFDVASYDAENAYFKDYLFQSAAGNHGSYAYSLEKNGKRYKFIGVDASLVPGPKRPFNFIGQLSSQDLNHLRDLMTQNQSDYTVWFGHYPTSSILTPSNLRNLISDHPGSFVYLAGHLHAFMGLVPRMYLSHERFLELELGDWMRSRRYRVAAFDHGLFSFVDMYFNEFPIILLTNPKDRHQHVPTREDPTVSLHSTHIRLLAFSLSPIVTCRLRIDGGAFHNCVESPEVKNLFTAPWNPHRYNDGVHSIEVTVTDELQRSRTVSQEFSFDMSSQSNDFAFTAKLILNYDMTIIWICAFVLCFVICIGPLAGFRVWHEVTLYRGGTAPKIQWRFLRTFVRKFWLLGSVNGVFWPMLFFYVYLLVGPWMVCEIIEGHVGWVFMWGMFVKGQFFPGTLSYLYGVAQMLFGQMPINLILGGLVDHKFRRQFRRGSEVTLDVDPKKLTKLDRFWPHFPFTLVILAEIILAGVYWHQYTTVAFILGPLRTWSVLLHLYLYHRVYHLKEHELVSGMKIWASAPRRE